ncbi:MAG: nucleotidyltransferase family protein [Bacteroidia bacterium]
MLSKEDILDILRRNKKIFQNSGVSEIGLFGSFSRNEQSPRSDIDILVDFAPGQENFDNFMKTCDVMDKLFQDNKIEVVTKNGLSPFIGPAILKEVIYV